MIFQFLKQELTKTIAARLGGDFEMGQSFNELSTEQVSWRVAIAKYSPTFESASSKDARRKESFFFFLSSCLVHLWTWRMVSHVKVSLL